MILDEIVELCKGVHCVDLGESFHMSIYYLLANIGFDTAENEPCKVCPLLPLAHPQDGVTWLPPRTDGVAQVRGFTAARLFGLTIRAVGSFCGA